MINKKSIEKLLEMPDDRLAAMVKLLLASTGADIPCKKFDEKSIRKIRAVLKEVNDADLARLETLIQKYKEEG